MSRKEIRLSGFGGQGIILSGFILGKAAAIYNGKYATFTQSYGPESRGGACSAQVIVSDEPVHYPHLVSPTVLVAMSQEAYAKYVGGLAPGGTLVVDEDLVEVGPLDGVQVLLVPATRLAEQELGHTIVANIVMLGFLTAVTDLVSVEAMREAVRTSVPRGTEDANMRAFDRGYEYGQERVAA